MIGPNILHTCVGILRLLKIQKFQLILLVSVMLCGVFLELLGLSLVPVFLSALFWPEKLREMPLPEEITWLIESSGILSDPITASMTVSAVFVAKALLTYSIQIGIVRFSLRRNQDLKLRLFRLYQSLPFSFHIQTSSAEIYQSIYSRAQQLAQNGLTSTLRLISDGLVAIGLGTALFLVSPSLVGLSALVIGLLLFLYIRGSSNYLRKAGRAANEGPVGMYRAMLAALNGYREIKLSGAESVFYLEAERESQKFIDSQGMFYSLSMLPRYAMEAAIVVTMVTWAAIQVQAGTSSSTLVAQFAIFVTAAARLLPLSSSLASSLSGLRFAEPSLADLEEDLRLEQSYEKKNQTKDWTDFEFLNLELDAVGFRYDGDRNTQALAEISLSIHRGDRLGIRGESGSGKSTLLNLILGFLTPSDGKVRVNGAPFELESSAWQSKLAYIPQEVFLFEGTIAENICLKPLEELSTLEHEHLNLAILNSRLQAFIDELPEGLRAQVGERGVQLSGGQRQRIAIARALFSGRQILIMDEATSALDLETERLIIEDLAQTSENVTMIVVGHRPQSLALCDTVLTLENGRLL